MKELRAIEKETPNLLAFVEFKEGQRYADFKPGADKIAAYGIAGLVAGGLMAKAGLFKGLLVALLAAKKLVIVGLMAIGAFISKLFKRKNQAAG